ncbi:MarR family winged helix-turn-helix transcriptional regulator [Paenibacillus segetis]|uniref:Transcriptional regulator n=1 Tax=Paenibacillus segetis TaxID=1325360 RepID=A0ABQ1YUV5_9BACL|nr:MarR family transcriptional regulator [Paenibacillus segetis]GGH37927.1 transcriptional regulator [Paenibacillus segetis]
MSIKDSLGYVITNTGRKLTQQLTLKFQPFGITSEQWAVLHWLTEEDGITQRELSRRTEKDPTNVTRILDQLEKKGWILRGANGEDRRSFLIFVTESGRELSQELLPIEAQFTRNMVQSLADEDIAILRRALSTINDHLNNPR